MTSCPSSSSTPRRRRAAAAPRAPRAPRCASASRQTGSGSHNYRSPRRRCRLCYRPGRRGAQEVGLVLGVELHAPHQRRRRAPPSPRCRPPGAVAGRREVQLLRVDTTCRSPCAWTLVEPPMSQAGRARNDAVVCPNRTGGVEHRVEVGPLRAARQPGSRLSARPHRGAQLRRELHALRGPRRRSHGDPGPPVLSVL